MGRVRTANSGRAGDEGDVLDRVLRIARDDARVRAAILSGSRADPTARPDAYQDVDVVFVVDDVPAVTNDAGFLVRFGEPAIVQRPDAMRGAAPRRDGGAAVLMQFTDGDRVDLTLVPSAAMPGFSHEGPSRVLYDPGGIVPPVPPDAATRFAPALPDARAFAEACNEFWWVAPYVAKGLARAELVYARHHLDTVMRGELVRMLDWYVGAESGLRRGAGKLGRDLGHVLDPALWRRLRATYAEGDEGSTWRALGAMTSLFRDVATGLAERLGLPYPFGDDARVTEHLRRVHAAQGAAAPVTASADAATGGVRSSTEAREPTEEEPSMPSPLVQAWTIHDRKHAALLAALPAGALDAVSPGGGRSVAQHFAHLHDMRLLWLRQAAPDLGEGLVKLGRDVASDVAGLARAMEASGAAVAALVERAEASDGGVMGFAPPVEVFVASMIAHESHHRGQVLLVLHLVGTPLPRSVTDDLWAWGVR